MPDDVHPQIQAVLDTMAELNLPKIEAGSASDARVLMEGTEHAGGGLTRILYQAPGMQPNSKQVTKAPKTDTQNRRPRSR